MAKKRFRAAGVAGAATAVLLGAGIAYSAIPDSGGVIHACFKDNGDLRVIDSSASSCKSNETALSWSQSGQRGTTGPTGARGPTGPRGPAGPTGPKGDAGPAGPTGPKGDPGTNGATGQQGPKGATGAAGANGVSGYQIVSGSVTTVPSGSTASGSAFCPTGKKVVGGGWDTDASRDVFVVSSTPNASGSGWLGTIQNNSTGSVQVVLSAACVSTS